MRIAHVVVVLMTLGLLAVGCGWKPPAPQATNTQGCADTDGPTTDTVDAAVKELPAAQWKKGDSGNTGDCALHWVVVTSGDASDSPQQVLFFDHNVSIGSPTPDPRPYITVTPMGNETASVQYQWRQGQDPACCPTGIGTVRVKIDNGKLEALDPIPSG